MSWAICDWGIGGLSFYNLLKERSGAEPVLYWSDSGAIPYGKLTKEALKERVDLVIRALYDRGARNIVIACNAASTIVPDLAMPSKLGVRVVGVIEPTIESIRGIDQNASFGIIGGKRTIQSQVYGKALRSMGHTVHQRIAQPLSALVEDGAINTEETRQQVLRILTPIKGVDYLVMACTHYVALKHQFAAIVKTDKFIDPAVETLTWIERNWGLANAPADPSQHSFVTTGSASETKRAALAAFSLALPRVQQIEI